MSRPAIIRAENEQERAWRAIEREVIRNLPFVLKLLRSPDWKFYFIPSQREALLKVFGGSRE